MAGKRDFRYVVIRGGKTVCETTTEAEANREAAKCGGTAYRLDPVPTAPRPLVWKATAKELRESGLEHVLGGPGWYWDDGNGEPGGPFPTKAAAQASFDKMAPPKAKNGGGFAYPVVAIQDRDDRDGNTVVVSQTADGEGTAATYMAALAVITAAGFTPTAGAYLEHDYTESGGSAWFVPVAESKAKNPKRRVSK